jgi:hypothetical protein
MKARTPPRSARILNQWVDSHARQLGQPPARVRNWLSFIVLGGALETAGFEGAGRRFTIKGGVALEMRLRHLARATKDLDLILNSGDGDLIQELEGALSRSYQGFSFRLKGQPELMPNGAARIEVALQYLGKAWGTVQVDVARHEGDGAEVEMVEAISLAPFGLAGPETLPCLSLSYHIAQKIHAMTLPPREGGRNERFRDLVDLLLLEEWVTDFDAVQAACRDVFSSRGTHLWPPFFQAPDHWAEPFERMASDLDLELTDLYHAAIRVRQLIARIDDSAEWTAELPPLDGLTATTWYFAIGPDSKLHRVPARIGESFFTGRPRPSTDILPEWQRDPGGVALIGVVVILQNRRPLFIERTSTGAFAIREEVQGGRVAFTPEIWMALAATLLNKSKAPMRAVRALAVFLSNAQGNLPCTLVSSLRVTSREAHKYFADFFQPSPSDLPWWDIWTSQPIRRT